MVVKSEQRSLVLAPSGKDSTLIAAALAHSHIEAKVCQSVADLVDEARRGVGAVLVAEEALISPAGQRLMQELIDDQPAWSDLPVVLLAKAGVATRLRLQLARNLGNVTLLE